MGKQEQTDEPFDVITMGRVGVDLYPQQSHVPLSEVRSFSKFLGGGATNVAVAAARYGRRTAVITKVGDDPFGKYVRDQLSNFRVDTRWVGTEPGLRTPIVFCELHPPDDFPILYYREPTAPDIALRPDELDLREIRRCRVLWTTGTGLSDEPSRSATLAALETRHATGHTIHDLDLRPTLWKDVNESPIQQRRALQWTTVAIGNEEEVAAVVGPGSPEKLAERLLDAGPRVAIVKLGPRGVLLAGDGQFTQIAPNEVEVVNGLGAGDAFGGAICHGLLKGWHLPRTVQFANAAGAYVASRLACADAMPTESQVLNLLAETPKGSAHPVKATPR